LTDKCPGPDATIPWGECRGKAAKDQQRRPYHIKRTPAKAALRVLRLAFAVGVCHEETTDNYEVITSILPRVTRVYLKGRQVVEVKPLVEDGCTSPGE